MTRPQPHTGRSLLEIFWQELDDIMDRLMEEDEPATENYWDGKSGGHDQKKFQEDYLEWAETRGQAQGVAYCIAVMTNPYTPDYDKVRDEAMRRWEDRHASD